MLRTHVTYIVLPSSIHQLTTKKKSFVKDTAIKVTRPGQCTDMLCGGHSLLLRADESRSVGELGGKLWHTGRVLDHYTRPVSKDTQREESEHLSYSVELVLAGVSS